MPSYSEKDTYKALMDPKVGDLYHECFSVWFQVIKVTPDSVIVKKDTSTETTEETLPRKAFVKYFCYEGQGVPWVVLTERGA